MNTFLVENRDYYICRYAKGERCRILEEMKLEKTRNSSFNYHDLTIVREANIEITQKKLFFEEFFNFFSDFEFSLHGQ